MGISQAGWTQRTRAPQGYVPNEFVFLMRCDSVIAAPPARKA